MRFLVFALLVCACASSPRPAVQATQTSPSTQAPRTTEAPHVASQAIDSAERGSRVALPRGAERPQLLYFAGELSAEERRELEKVAPGVRVEAGLSRSEATARAAEAHGIDAQYATPEFLRAAKDLVWVQAQSTGVERYLALPELARSEEIVLTNLRGSSGPAIADHAFAMLLALTRDLAVQLAARGRGAWLREGSGELVPIALQGRTLLVVGLGGIGSEIARRGDGFGMRVIATRRGDAPAPEHVAHVGKPGELLALLPEADVVAIAVPLTPETEHLFGAAAFAAMKPGSYLVNVARGKVVDTEALLEALRSKKLAGACLDVTDPEPLPADHPLWKFPNVVVTPHVSARSELTEERGFAMFRENLRRFDAGEPLLNVVDKAAGY